MPILVVLYLVSRRETGRKGRHVWDAVLDSRVVYVRNALNCDIFCIATNVQGFWNVSVKKTQENLLIRGYFPFYRKMFLFLLLINYRKDGPITGPEERKILLIQKWITLIRSSAIIGNCLFFETKAGNHSAECSHLMRVAFRQGELK